MQDKRLDPAAKVPAYCDPLNKAFSWFQWLSSFAMNSTIRTLFPTSHLWGFICFIPDLRRNHLLFDFRSPIFALTVAFQGIEYCSLLVRVYQ
jgi:hypothetical protein